MQCKLNSLQHNQPKHTVKVSLDLQQARKLHRQRIQSIENVKIEMNNRERIFKDIFDLENSWNEIQFQKQKQSIIHEKSREKSLDRVVKTLERAVSPETKKLTKKCSIQQPNDTPLKKPHRTQIFLQSTVKISRTCQNKVSTEKPQQGLFTPKHQTKNCIMQVFYGRRSVADDTPHKHNKTSVNLLAETRKVKKSYDILNTPSPTSKIQTKTIENEQDVQKGKHLSLVSVKRGTTSIKPTKNPGDRLNRLEVRLNSSSMEIENILFQQVQGKVYG